MDKACLFAENKPRTISPTFETSRKDVRGWKRRDREETEDKLKKHGKTQKGTTCIWDRLHPLEPPMSPAATASDFVAAAIASRIV